MEEYHVEIGAEMDPDNYYREGPARVIESSISISKNDYCDIVVKDNFDSEELQSILHS